ncbi:MAG: type II secretion system F family protein [Phycisphaerales bacterium]|nr:type II secretion system F family protein [Phycisphaerales bacterium]
MHAAIEVTDSPSGSTFPLRKYSYQARRADGTLIRGVIESGGPSAAVRMLRRDALVVVAIELASLEASVGVARQLSVGRLSAHFKRDDVLALCQQLSVMLKTGVPLPEALETYALQASNKHVAAIVRRIKEDVSEGDEFSKVLAKWPRVFPPILISLIRAAEASGLLAEMMERVGKELAKQRKTSRQVTGAMIYPGIMLTVAIAAVTIIMVFVLPKFQGLFMAQGENLPTPTKVLMAVSDFLRFGWPIYLPLLITAVAGGWVFVRSTTGRLFVDRMKLTMPVLGKLFRFLYVSRIASTMSTLLAAGVSLLEVIAICREVTNNLVLARMWDDLEQRVQHGQDMSTAFSNCPYFPRNVAAMFHAGEHSGRLPEVLQQAALFAEEELDTAVKACTSMIEPMMIVIMGGLVGGIASAMLLPIFNMSKMVH